jgi:diadenosine tetraphosphate (Ap4A) HIT family hydrolase
VPPRSLSDEKYLLDLVAQVLAEPDYLWQHCFPGLVGDPGADGRPRPLPVDGYFPRHRLVVEYWERQHSAPVPIMDEGPSVSGVSRGHQRRLYDQRRQAFADANGLRLVILDYRGFEANPSGQLRRDPVRDLQIVASALRAAGAVTEPQRAVLAASGTDAGGEGCTVCRIVESTAGPRSEGIVWRDGDSIAFLSPFPAAFGHTIVAPTRHWEQVTGDFTLHHYLGLHRVVHAVSEAVRLALAPERVYICSLGSQPLEAHVQWQIVPCPPGLPLGQQQLALLEAATAQPLQLTPEEAGQLAAQFRSHLPSWMRDRAR